MVSNELWNATRRLWNNSVNDADHVWAPWVNVSPSLGYSMVALIGVLIENAFLFDRMVFPANRTKAYQELARLATVSPWSELFNVLPNEEGLTICGHLSKVDLEMLHRERRKHSQILAD